MQPCRLLELCRIPENVVRQSHILVADGAYPPRCPLCNETATRVVGIAAPMSDSGTELVPKLPVVLMDMQKMNDGREKFIGNGSQV